MSVSWPGGPLFIIQRSILPARTFLKADQIAEALEKGLANPGRGRDEGSQGPKSEPPV